MGVLSVLMPWAGEGPGQSFLAGSFVSPEQNRQRERSRRAQFCRILRALLGTLRGGVSFKDCDQRSPDPHGPGCVWRAGWKA